MKTKRSNGVTIINPLGSKVNAIQRDIDNTSVLEEDELKARSKRKWEAPDGIVPGKTIEAPPFSSTPLPS
jgi:hypothetical protein